jgi:hypothetical protein
LDFPFLAWREKIPSREHIDILTAVAIRLRPMSFEQLSYLAQIVASLGVIVSLIFVGRQIRQNTGALQRNEHNSTMEQWTVIRMAIAKTPRHCRIDDRRPAREA